MTSVSSSRIRNTRRNIIWGMINKMVILIVPFIIRTVIIRSMGPDYLGLTSLFTSILQVLNLTELGFSSAVVFCMYKPIAEDDTDTLCALLNMFRKVYRLIGCTILLVGLAISPFLPKLIKGTWPSDINIYLLYFIYLACTVVSYLLFAYKSALLTAHQRVDVDVNITTVTFIIQYILQILSIVFLKSFYAYALSNLLLTIVGNIIRAAITNRMYPQIICKGNLDEDLKNDIKKRVAGAFVQKICATTRNSFDSIFLSAFLGLTIITKYGNYYYILSAIHGLLVVIITGITASVGNSIAVESIEKNHNDLRKFSFMYAWLGGWCTVCLLCLYQPFMEIWVGTKLMFPINTVIFFCVYFYSLTIGDVRTVYTTGSGLWWEGRYRSITETIANVVLNWTLGKLFGVNGIIVATIISIVFINFLWGTQILYKYYFTSQKSTVFYLDHCYYIVVVVIVCAISYRISVLFWLSGIIGFLLKAVVVTLISNILFGAFFARSQFFSDSKELLVAVIKRRF